jgi:hypothetical protein
MTAKEDAKVTAEKEITLNQLGVMIEKVGSDVKAVAEGHEVIRREMQEIKNELISEIDTVKGAVRYLATDLSKVKEKVSRIDERVDRIEKKLDVHMLQPAHV